MSDDDNEVKLAPGPRRMQPRRTPLTSRHSAPGLQRMATEAVFDNQRAMRRAMKVLIEEGFEVRWLDGRFDPEGELPAKWLLIWTYTNRNADEFSDYVFPLITGLDGFVTECSIEPVSDAELALWDNDTRAQLADSKPH